MSEVLRCDFCGIELITDAETGPASSWIFSHTRSRGSSATTAGARVLADDGEPIVTGYEGE